MTDNGGPGPDSAPLIDQTARLVEFLRELARTRQPRVIDVGKHERVQWLADLPPGVDVMSDAGPDEAILTMERVTAEPPPAVPPALRSYLDDDDVSDSSLTAPPLLSDGDVDREGQQAYDAWLPGWQTWAESDRELRPRRDWYRSLSATARRLEQQDDEVELVLGTGLLSWDSPKGLIRHPLVSTPVQIRIDAATGTLAISVAPGASSRFADRDLLANDDGFEPGPAENIRQAFREEAPQPLSDSLKDRFTDWRTASFERCRPYDHTWMVPEPSSTPCLTFSPVLVLRRRDQSALIEYLERMWGALTGPDARAPLGLAQLLTPLEPDQRLEWLESEGAESGIYIGEDPLFPKPANPEQALIMERLKGDNGVVVQGPPGTGKTHTIANLISALLARGQRVLVTSQKAQALRVLHRQLPDEIQQLCVSMTDLQRGGSVELDRSVAEISRRFDSFSPEAQARLVDDLNARRRGELQRASTLKEQIRSLRETETYQHPEIAPGYQGTLASIAQQVRALEPRFGGWMVRPFPADAPGDAPLSTEEIGELRRLLATASPNRRSRATQNLPDANLLPTGADIGRLIEDEAAATAVARDAESDLSLRLKGLDGTWLEYTQRQVEWVEAALAGMGLPRGSQPTAPEWLQRFIDDGLADRNSAVWEQLSTVAAQARTARERLAHIQLHNITLPPLMGDGPEGLAGQLTAAQALREHIAAGNELKKRLRPAVQKAADPLLSGAAVDGVRITGIAQLDLVIDRLWAEQTARMLEAQWASVGLRIDSDAELVFRIAELDDAASSLQSARQVLDTRNAIRSGLQASGVHLRLADRNEWDQFAASLAAVRLRVAADAASAELEKSAETLKRLAAATASPPPEVSALEHAVLRRNADDYRAVLDQLDQARADQRAQLRCDDLYGRLNAVHPGFAQLLDRTASDEAWDERLGQFGEAWAWGKASTFFDAQRRPGLEADLDRDLNEALAAAAQTTAEVAAAEAWRQSLTRMNAAHAQALRSYQSFMSDRGAGKGRYAHRYERAARQAMEQARGAVPAWIMPISEVLTTIPPDPGSFDVVIVDEASQASIEALFLLWLAPRVIVVGDDRQCTPSQVSHGELQPIFDRVDDYLRDVPDYLRTAFTPRSSLFSLLTSRFGSVIRLREHFRCMPEIIGWSSRQFYADQPLIPLRQYGADRLQPVKTTYVSGAFTEGQSSTLRNEVEAEALVDQLVMCLSSADCRGKDFGVVVLQGRAQIRLIEDLLEERVPPDVWESRRLRVGGPPDFQGDERDVVFLSMVVADRARAVTGLEMQRRFNVAASRAKDQLWLFHSVTPDLLSVADLRRSLLTYALDPPSPGRVEPLGKVTEDERCRPFDSLFEQRVFLRIRDRGFTVVPQFEVNGRRIDLVVVGAKGRLAVECDGDAWHSSPEQRLADIDRELELKRCGWEFWRIRESEFYFDPDRALASLWDTLERRGIKPGEGKTSDPSGDDDWSPLGDLSNEEGLDEVDDDAAPVVATPSSRMTLTSSNAARAMTLFDRPQEHASHVDEQAAGEPGPLNHDRKAPLPPSTGEVRSWALGQGLRVGQRGRLAPEIIAAWNSAHPDRPM